MLLPGTGVPPTWDWGTPPPPRLGLGFPLERTGDQGENLGLEYLLERTWERTCDWVTPLKRPWDKKLGRNVGPETRAMIPPPLAPSGCGQTDTCENSTFPILRMRAVISNEVRIERGFVVCNRTASEKQISRKLSLGFFCRNNRSSLHEFYSDFCDEFL